VYPLTKAVRERYKATRDGLALHDAVAAAAADLEGTSATTRRNVGKLAEVLAKFPVARTKPFFDAMEKEKPGSGGLYSVAIDPWKCSGCMECIDVCGPGALKPRVQDEPLLEVLQERFEFLSKTANTPARFVDGAVRPDGDIKRMMLDRSNYYATTGGHGACRGCGEVTAIRLVMSANHAIQGKRRKEHLLELEALIDRLRREGDSIGARVTVVASGVPPGLGEPVFDRLDADLAHAMMCINAVKAVEVGDGFRVVEQRGSEHRDEISPAGFLSNHAGGTLGGISSGQDVVVSLALKPTSSIVIPGRTIDVHGQPTEVSTTGRHDPCVGIRAVPIAEAMLALVLMDHYLRHRAQNADVRCPTPIIPGSA